MSEYEYVKGRRFGCDCGDPRHALAVGPFFGEEMDAAELANEVVTLTLVVEPDGWKQRIKGAVMALFGRRWEMHEMIIDREEWPEFVEHINTIDAACKRAQAVLRSERP